MVYDYGWKYSSISIYCTSSSTSTGYGSYYITLGAMYLESYINKLGLMLNINEFSKIGFLCVIRLSGIVAWIILLFLHQEHSSHMPAHLVS